MLAVAGGDVRAFVSLVEKYQKPLINLIYHFVHNRTQAEELTQEVFVRAYLAAPRYKPKAKFSTWLYRIATNLCLNELKSKKSSGHMPLDELESLGNAEQKSRDRRHETRPDVAFEYRELLDFITRALDELPANQRIAVILHRFEGLSYQEIAQALGCSVSAVESLLYRAKQRLREMLVAYRRRK